MISKAGPPLAQLWRVQKVQKVQAPPKVAASPNQVQGMVQYMLEEEVTEFLGRLKSARRSDADNDSGYRNGYAPARKLTLSSG